MSVAAPAAVTPARHRLALASLVGLAMLWGSTFFSTKGLAGRIPVPDLLFVRFAVMALAVGLCAPRAWRMGRATLRHGLVIGSLYGVAQLVQTVGLQHTAASTSGFLTALAVVFTPFMAAGLLRERVGGATWLAVALATAGLGMLTIKPGAGFQLGVGELLTLAPAVLYAAHIIAVDHWVTDQDAMSLALLQMVVVALWTGAFALPGGIVLPSGAHDWALMLYLALVAGAIPIVLQLWAQTMVESTTAAVLMAGEPVWAAVFAVALGGEHVTWQMLSGGTSLVAAMMLVTLAPRWRRPSRRG